MNFSNFLKKKFIFIFVNLNLKNKKSQNEINLLSLNKNKIHIYSKLVGSMFKEILLSTCVKSTFIIS